MTRSPLRQAVWVSGWPARRILLLTIGAYRLTLGQLIGGGCRFHPSCSAYAADAVRNAGALRGSALAVWRILRCSPLSRGGVDLPPGRRTWVYDTAIRQDRAA